MMQSAIPTFDAHARGLSDSIDPAMLSSKEYRKDTAGLIGSSMFATRSSFLLDARPEVFLELSAATAPPGTSDGIKNNDDDVSCVQSSRSTLSQEQAQQQSQQSQHPFSVLRQSILQNSSSASNAALHVASGKDSFSFMHSRPVASCSKAAEQGTYTQSSASLSEKAPPTSSKSQQMCSPAHSSSAVREGGTGSNASSPHAKRKSSAQRRRVTFSQIMASPSLTAAKPYSTFANVSSLPLRLPRPPLALISDPHKDLLEHLRRHGMHEDAQNFSQAPSITVGYILQAWVLQAAQGGPVSLLDVSSTFMDTYARFIREQLHTAQQANADLPKYFSLAHDAVEEESPAALPSHIFAIHGRGEEEKGYLVPCHAMLYILQCVSLPAMCAVTGSSASVTNIPTSDDERVILPVVPINVPRPKEFGLLHRFIYTHDTSALLLDLLPMRFIARYCEQKQSKDVEVDVMADLCSGVGVPTLRLDANSALYNAEDEAQEAANDATKTIPNHAVDALAQLGAPSLLTMAHKIHAAWANGVAIGFIEPSYWTTLNQAWSLIVAALGTKKCRLLDAEQRGLRLGMKL